MNLPKINQKIILQYLMSVLLVILVTVPASYVKLTADHANIVVLYIFIVVISAYFWGKGPAILVSFLSVLVYDFFLVPPYLSFSVADVQYLFTFAGLLVVGLIISSLASRNRVQAAETKEYEAQTEVLYRLSSGLAAAESLDEVLQVVMDNVGKIFSCKTAIYIFFNNKMEIIKTDTGFPDDENEKAIAFWVYSNNKSAGKYTRVLEAAKGHYIPLNTSQGVIGVLGVFLDEKKVILSKKEENLFSALTNQSAVAIQRARLAEESHRMELLKKTEKLQTALLNSISHDLRTPLVSITGVISSLLEDTGGIDQKQKKELLETAYKESDRMNRLVGNLLDMSRVEVGNLKLRIHPVEFRDLIGTVLRDLKDKIEGRELKIKIPEEFPEIPLDFTLMMRVFINLIDNALKYSALGMPVEITAEVLGEYAEIKVIDQGAGIPEEDLTKIFQKFYRVVKPDQINGTGLGLSICKGIVEAHNGIIRAENNTEKGVTITVLLPLKIQGV